MTSRSKSWFWACDRRRVISVTQTDTLSPALCPALVFTWFVGQRDLIPDVDGPH